MFNLDASVTFSSIPFPRWRSVILFLSCQVPVFQHFLSFISLVSDYFSRLLRSLFMTAQTSSLLVTPAISVPFTKLLRLHSTPFSRYLKRILNRVRQDLPLVYITSYWFPSRFYSTHYHEFWPCLLSGLSNDLTVHFQKLSTACLCRHHGRVWLVPPFSDPW